MPAGGVLLLLLLVASFGLFFAAHLLLFALYLPARHVQFSLPIVWALAGGGVCAYAPDDKLTRIKVVRAHLIHLSQELIEMTAARPLPMTVALGLH